MHNNMQLEQTAQPTHLTEEWQRIASLILDEETQTNVSLPHTFGFNVRLVELTNAMVERIGRYDSSLSLTPPAIRPSEEGPQDGGIASADDNDAVRCLKRHVVRLAARGIVLQFLQDRPPSSISASPLPPLVEQQCSYTRVFLRLIAGLHPMDGSPCEKYDPSTLPRELLTELVQKAHLTNPFANLSAAAQDSVQPFVPTPRERRADSWEHASLRPEKIALLCKMFDPSEER